MYAVLLAVGVFQGLTFWSISEELSIGPGLAFFDHIERPGAAGAMPMTAEASEALAGMEGLLLVESIDGVDVDDLEPKQVDLPIRLRRHALAEGRTRNTFVLTGNDGVSRQVELQVGRPVISGLPWIMFTGAAYHLGGLFYLVVGLWVWRRRPDDRAASWLVLLGAVAAVQLAQPAPDVPLGRVLNIIAAAILPLYGPTALNLAVAFIGLPLGRRMRWLRRVDTVAAVLLGLALIPAFGAWSRGTLSDVVFRGLFTAVGVVLGASILGFIWLCWKAMRPGHPPMLRRRARVLAVAVAVAFGLPTLELMVLPFFEHMPLGFAIPNLICLVSFPLMMAYATVRYQLFDLRIVVRRGAVYAGLSLAVSLAFVGVVLLMVDHVGSRAQSTVALWFTSVTLIVGVGLLQLRVQRWVDRLVNRRRDEYAAAVREVSEAMVRARTKDQAVDTARKAFLDTLGLARVYVAVRTDGRLGVLCLGNREDPETGRLPPELPTDIRLDTHAPLARALVTGAMVSAYDAENLTSLSHLDSEERPKEFFGAYGVELVVPLGPRRGEGSGPLGLLILGPRQDGQPLDSEDIALIQQLANQLTVAAENAMAFEEIRALKDGLEDQVKARTQALEQALDDLKGAEAQIIESEKQAMLGRLVAGIIHEANTPLGALLSSTDTLQRLMERLLPDLETADLDGPRGRRIASVRELLALQRTSASRLSGLMTSLRSFTGLDESELRDVDVREGIDAALRVLASDLGDRVRVHRDYPARVPAVRAHVQRLNQVFLHVLQNAAKAIEGDGEIRIALSSSDAQLRISIHDDGPGIPAPKQKDLFEFGFTTKGGRMALRLGLPSSVRTVRELGGDIVVESEEGVGTTVHIDLPRAEVAEAAPVGAK